MEQFLQLLPMILIFVVMYLVLIIPQRRREKKTREMLSALKQGDTVTSIGGIKGKIINISDDDITVETSIERTQIIFKRWAIKEVEKPVES
jgi:preprotein translocase subunit YajC